MNTTRFVNNLDQRFHNLELKRNKEEEYHAFPTSFE
jgi:hypothetical protein